MFYLVNEYEEVVDGPFETPAEAQACLEALAESGNDTSDISSVSGSELDIDDYEPDYYDDSMDGDPASALASVGWGTDEDYGDFGYENGDF